MQCLQPIRAWQTSQKLTKNGKKYVTLNKKEVTNSKLFWEELQLPCGKCLACKENARRDWALRCVEELKESSTGYFVTLTYEEGKAKTKRTPWNEYQTTLDKKDIQLFLKRLRKKTKNKIRFFMCGEYGEKSLRAHYHMLLYNIPEEWIEIRGGRLQSKIIEETWGLGQISIGTITAASAAYVRQYTAKKQKEDLNFYEAYNLPKPYINMSRKPGIGLKGKKFVYSGGLELPAPKALIEKHPNAEEIKKERREIAIKKRKEIARNTDLEMWEYEEERKQEFLNGKNKIKTRNKI